MSFRTIREAQKAVWPTVRESLDRVRSSREAAKLPGATNAAKSRAQKPWNRVVADETVWALAKADLLALPEQAAVVKAAKAWARYYGDDFRDFNDMDPEERALYDAVQVLAATPVEIPEEVA